MQALIWLLGQHRAEMVPPLNWDSNKQAFPWSPTQAATLLLSPCCCIPAATSCLAGVQLGGGTSVFCCTHMMFAMLGHTCQDPALCQHYLCHCLPLLHDLVMVPSSR